MPISKTASLTTPIASDDTVTYTLTVTNTGQVPAGNVAVLNRFMLGIASAKMPR